MKKFIRITSPFLYILYWFNQQTVFEKNIYSCSLWKAANWTISNCLNMQISAVTKPNSNLIEQVIVQFFPTPERLLVVGGPCAPHTPWYGPTTICDIYPIQYMTYNKNWLENTYKSLGTKFGLLSRGFMSFLGIRNYSNNRLC